MEGKYGEEEGGWSSCYEGDFWGGIRLWGHPVSNDLSFGWGKKSSFGKIDGAGILTFTFLSLPYSLLLAPKRLGWRMFGVWSKVGGVGTPLSFEILMIGKWGCEETLTLVKGEGSDRRG